MGFNVKDWKDYPDTSTPITQAALEDMETRLSAYTDTKVANVVTNVKDFGAKGDGSTDDTAAIQSAIDYLLDYYGQPYGPWRVPRGVLYLPAGTYMVSGVLRVTSAWGFVMRGDGPRATELRVKAGSSLESVLDLNGCFSGSFEDFSLSGSGTHSVQHGIHLRWGTSTVNMTSGSSTLTSTYTSGGTYAFTSSDVGQKIRVAGAGAAGGDLDTTIATYVSSTQVTLAASASTTVTGGRCYTAGGPSSRCEFRNIYISDLTYVIGVAVEQRDARWQTDECLFENVTVSGANYHGPVTITNASPGVLLGSGYAASKQSANTRLLGPGQAGQAVVLMTTGSLPTGLTASETAPTADTKYYVRDYGTDGAGKFRLSATDGGTAINTSSAGSGTHWITRADFWQHGFRFGNTIAGNVFNMHLVKCNSNGNRFGYAFANTGGSVIGGGTQSHVVDFLVQGLHEQLHVQDIRSETAGRFFESTGYTGQQVAITLENVEVLLNNLYADGFALVHKMAGVLSVRDWISLQSDGAYTPKFSVGNLGGGQFVIDGMVMPAAASSLISNVSGAQVQWEIHRYVEIDTSNVFVAHHSYLTGGVTGGIAAASTMTLPNRATDCFVITGTGATISTIPITGWDGRTVTLVFTAANTVNTSGNLFLASTLSATDGDTLTLTCDGSNWYEVARSVN